MGAVRAIVMRVLPLVRRVAGKVTGTTGQIATLNGRLAQVEAELRGSRRAPTTWPPSSAPRRGRCAPRRDP
ncbi:MAG: hypothetical protein V9G12_25965 [Microthrixaceae bacterium]